MRHAPGARIPEDIRVPVSQVRRYAHGVSEPRHRILDSPTGDFLVRLAPDGRIETAWVAMLADRKSPTGANLELGDEDPTMLPGLCDRILRSMHGDAIDFEDVDLPSGTPFQRAIWRATRAIPPGSTMTYGRLATEIGRAGAARAVGQAMRRNPQPIITPCHRVVASNGLGGFGGDGPNGTWNKIKTGLIDAERDFTA